MEIQYPIIADVTQDDIDNGQPMNSERCPIQRALRRALPEAHRVSVGSSYIWVHTPNPHEDNIVIKHTAESQRFRTAFDNFQSVEPVTLTFQEGQLYSDFYKILDGA